MECDKHPNNFDGYNPREFAEKFVKTSYFFQKEAYIEIISEYKKESDGDKKLGRFQLISGLEEVITAIKDPLLKGMTRVCKACKNYMKNPFEK